MELFLGFLSFPFSTSTLLLSTAYPGSVDWSLVLQGGDVVWATNGPEITVSAVGR